jgi:hypothetical protein
MIEPLFAFAVIIFIILGVADGMQKMENCRKGKIKGVKSSKNLFTFLFLD